MYDTFTAEQRAMYDRTHIFIWKIAREKFGLDAHVPVRAFEFVADRIAAQAATKPGTLARAALAMFPAHA